MTGLCCSTVRATVNLPFTDEHGKVRKMSIIVCEVISYIPHSYYDRKLQRLLPTYKQVSIHNTSNPTIRILSDIVRSNTV